jgi:hypothetical protein
MNNQIKDYCHLFNSTFTATERTSYCILENYQTPHSVRVLEVLQPFIIETEFLSFTAPPKKDAKKDAKAKNPLAKLQKLSHIESNFFYHLIFMKS